jgi:hypothetical protein
MVMKSEKLLFYNFIISFFLVRLQPFYYFPFIRSFLFNTHTLARIFILLNLIIILSLLWNKKINLNLDKKISILILFFFITLTLSIIFAININSFLISYKEFVFGIIFFINTLYILKARKKIELFVKFINITIFLNLFTMLIIYFFPNWLKIFQFFIYEKYLDVLRVNLWRNRYFIEFLDFALLPFIFYQFFLFENNYKSTSQRIKKITIGIVLFSFSIFFALISNFRTHILMLFFSLIFVFLFIFNKKTNLRIKSLIIFFFLFFSLNFIVKNFFIKTTFERFNLQEEELGSIIGRFKMWDYAKEMFFSKTLIGVGLGNYYDYLPNKEKITFSLFEFSKLLNQVTLIDPHNIFFSLLSQAGILSNVFLLALIFYFLKKDYSFIKINDNKLNLIKTFIISFWSIFLYSLINPGITFHFWALFFVFRAVIINLSLLKKRK